jgi:hypothetical protein
MWISPAQFDGLTKHMFGIGYHLQSTDGNPEVQVDSRAVQYLLYLSGKADNSQECCGILWEQSGGIGVCSSRIGSRDSMKISATICHVMTTYCIICANS